MEETEGHTHTDACYTEEDRLVCTEPGVVAHTHTDACYEIRQELTCVTPEHVHTEECREKSDNSADTENADDWARSVEGVTLTGRWDVDLVEIARSQLGYAESTRNFRLDDNGRKLGYTRYGAWFGSPYGHWCVMFAGFCMQYAGITQDDIPYSSNTDNFAFQFRDRGLYAPAESYTPAVGDIIFFNAEEHGPIDHVGIVEELVYAPAPEAPAAEGDAGIMTLEEFPESGEESLMTLEEPVEPAPAPQPVLLEIHTIEGNAEDAVRQKTYAADDPIIKGYGRIGYAQSVLHPEPVETPESEPGIEANLHPEFIYEDEQMTVKLTVNNLTLPLPEEAVLVVTPITGENYPDALETAAFTAQEGLVGENEQLSGFSLFDLRLVGNEGVLELPPEAYIQVTADFKQPLFDPTTAQEASGLHLITMDPLVNPVADMMTLEAAPMAEGEIAGEETPTVEVPEAEPRAYTPVTYTAPEQSSYSGTEQGVNHVEFTQRGMKPFAVALLSQTKQGNFWKVNRSQAEFNTNSQYMLVSVEGNYALTMKVSGRNGSQVTMGKVPVQLQPVKDNPDYYEIPNAPQEAKFSYKFDLQHRYLARIGAIMKPSYFVNPNDGALYTKLAAFGTPPQGANPDIMRINGTGKSCFNLVNNRMYLHFNGDKGQFVRLNNQDFSAYGGNSNARTADMLMLELVNVTLTIPDDAVANGDSGGKPGSASKPNYLGYITPSGEKTGSYDAETAQVSYASDPSTSQLEQYFGDKNSKKDYNIKKGDNGKAMLDKSVIYGHDDYSAFTEYPNGTFSVTLSALGQSFIVDEQKTKVPIDVLLILDLSNSMNEKDNGQSDPRAKILVDSMNKTMDRIMQAHPDNRVCAVGYNSGAYNLLGLGHHWKGEGGQYFKYENKTVSPTGLSGVISGAIRCEKGTFTQMGIAQGYDLLMREVSSKGTTYTTPEGVTKPRKPVIILVSDGEPTHCTNHYMDVLNSPYYGDGQGNVSNAKGVMGYYTILSANYYKRMVGIRYNNPATMYTIAFGMKENDFKQDGVGTNDRSAATNHHRATIMNPTQANINALSDAHTQDSDKVELAMQQMLQGKFRGETQRAAAVLNETTSIGGSKTHCFVPVLQNNPYRGNYAYADKAYLNNTGNSGIDAAFEEIIQLNTVYDFSYETQANKPLTITDPIGEGMEMKGDPVLRVNGKNYTHTGKTQQGNATVYTYSGIVDMDAYSGRTVDLSTIRVQVETDAQGLQTAKLEIPPKSLPTYTADPTMSYFREALPLRLIYQVGLSPAGQSKVDSLPAGESATFYTNRYQGGAHAAGTLQPSSKNHYYEGSGWNTTSPKTSNPTGTDGHSLMLSGSSTNVSYNLGNNGKLTLSRTASAELLTVKKQWQNYDGTVMTEGMPAEITAKLYRIVEGTEAREDVLEFKLNADNGWQKVFTAAELSETPGQKYLYYVEELTPEDFDFKVSYEHNGVAANGADIVITVTNRYKYSDFFLPKTGGSGTAAFTVTGSLLMAGSALYLIVSRRRKRG